MSSVMMYSVVGSNFSSIRVSTWLQNAPCPSVGRMCSGIIASMKPNTLMSGPNRGPLRIASHRTSTDEPPTCTSMDSHL